jgi:hypothetical protein
VIVELFSWKFDVDILPEYIEEKVKRLTLEIVEKDELNRLFFFPTTDFSELKEKCFRRDFRHYSRR